ncbi:MAG: trypsin-like peptidase domain-containing protein [Clostridia bacterium]|nr:trypsin-like peptidase domain-containing protein [Clostridia bacterium]
MEYNFDPMTGEPLNKEPSYSIWEGNSKDKKEEGEEAKLSQSAQSTPAAAWNNEQTRLEDEILEEAYGAPKKKKINKKVLLISIIVAAVVIVGGILALANGDDEDANEANSFNYSLEHATGSEMTIQEIAEKNADAVVEITTESVVTDSWMQQYVTEGAGSGVIIEAKQGYIITNNHVIQDARKITVTLHNGDSYQASVVGADSVGDIAVIKIQADDLVAASLGNSDDLQVGDLAVAIGNPLGQLGGTVTSGIISALNREITIDGTNLNLLQTDASINPGNSGGGLFNQYGQLVGIVDAKVSEAGIEGLSFAIPINNAAKIAENLIKNGRVGERGQAGIKYKELTIAEALECGFPPYGGIYIMQIVGKQASEGGLQIGDMLYYIGKEQVESEDQVLKLIQQHKPGEKLKFVVIRDNKTVTCTVTLQ